MEIVLSESAIQRIDKLRSNSRISRVDIVEQALFELERRAENFKAILEDDPINHDLTEQEGIELALEAQRAVRAKRH